MFNMKKLVFLFLLLGVIINCTAQTKKVSNSNTPIKDDVVEAPPPPPYIPEVEEVKKFEDYIADEMPEYPGGEDALLNFIAKNLKYPIEDYDKDIQGKVITEFQIEKDGSLSNFKVVNSISSGLDAEALRVIKRMPRWKPAKYKGVPVKMIFSLPIVFHID